MRASKSSKRTATLFIFYLFLLIKTLDNFFELQLSIQTFSIATVACIDELSYVVGTIVPEFFTIDNTFYGVLFNLYLQDFA